ncbi:MAG: haloalkane dehalogenase, partial [Sphingomonadaceae bacterium]|nr:haloalkane dehalogenase [Sphingomonadaceae bacterium]
KRELSAAEIAAYDAPYPDESYKAGARVFPRLVPVTPEHASVAENKAAWEVLAGLDIPFITAFSDSDPITGGGEKIFHERLPAAKGQPHVTLKGAHFLQEDCPDDIVALLDRLATKG